MNPLSDVESACALLQQEELQREVLKENKLQQEASALYGRGPATCSVKDLKRGVVNVATKATSRTNAGRLLDIRASTQGVRSFHNKRGWKR